MHVSVFESAEKILMRHTVLEQLKKGLHHPPCHEEIDPNCEQCALWLEVYPEIRRRGLGRVLMLFRVKGEDPSPYFSEEDLRIAQDWIDAHILDELCALVQGGDVFSCFVPHDSWLGPKLAEAVTVLGDLSQDFSPHSTDDECDEEDAQEKKFFQEVAEHFAMFPSFQISFGYLRCLFENLGKVPPPVILDSIPQEEISTLREDVFSAPADNMMSVPAEFLVELISYSIHYANEAPPCSCNQLDCPICLPWNEAYRRYKAAATDYV